MHLPVYECLATELLPNPYYEDNCATVVPANGACPLPTGENEPAPPQPVMGDDGVEIGTIPTTLDLVFYDKRVGNDHCKMLVNRTWTFLDACYNVVSKVMI